MIEFDNVTKTYEKNEKDALKDINLRIESGEFVFLVGRSGAGKSTFIKLLLREIDATSGVVRIKGHDISKLSKAQIPYLRRKLGVVFQDFRLLENKNVYENVAYAMEIIGRPEKKIRKKVPLALSMVGLSDRMYHYPNELSGGEQQRVVIARAIINNPSILICDEPTGNLDPETSKDIMRILLEINRHGTTTVVVTHDMNIVKLLNKRVLTLEDGRLTGDSSKGGIVNV
ncbi:cell division ATP-binding protein FtsE [uncultured Pseudoramibacter sp.]|jgi:cell division transport system ATP-binding protein|uniref:Cell division ATP-binding protein FtsE n=1 Tax=Candidatus Pseudoramibacter fermentans TaxID=2594427 RepID=A0A6L5GRL5_9FIRM|nr:cell division ATP-binding protein FtsE [uncultured Pseudoramibacter sp.]MQM72793.1 cell division ATP-binding protein FtsE [Candidatus Pseudoramibacter fermentans]RRF93852.1 MAG: cell division ATP-binding protein FtsE [Eubacteriaceae bacterium]